MRPPLRFRASAIVTLLPARASSRAAIKPAAPAPTIKKLVRCGGAIMAPSGDFLRELHVLLNQEDRDAALAEAPYDPRQLAHNQRRETLTRLIEQQHFWVADESTGERQHLLLAA